MGLLAVHLLFGVPWQPVLSITGAFLFAIFVCGFTAAFIGRCIYQIRWSLAERRPVTWEGKLVGWVAAPALDESGGQTGRWLAVKSPEAAGFLAALNDAPGAEQQVLVGGIPSRIELLPDESWPISVRWCATPHSGHPPAAAQGSRDAGSSESVDGQRGRRC
jgi:hypothetical protein